MISHRLFLCGSMCEGMVHRSLIEEKIQSVEKAYIRASVYRLPVGYPVLLENGEDRIEGELVHFESSQILFPLLDEFHAYKEEAPEKSLYFRKRIEVALDSERLEAYCYFINPRKLPRGSQKIAAGNWQDDFRSHEPMTETLSIEEKDYLKMLANCSGRAVIPYTNMTRDLERRGIVVDKGRRPALTQLGKEIYRYLGL